MRKKIVAFILLTALVLSMTACKASGEKRYEASFLQLFDTVTQTVGYAESEEKFSEYSQKLYDCLDEYNKLYDIYNDYEGINNIKTINDNAGISPVKVDRKIIDLLLFSKEMYELTDGKVNVVYGAVLSLWHEHREVGIDDPENATLPDYEELKLRAQHTDFSKMIIDEEASTVYLEDPEMSLDVGAIAKGYAVEKTVLTLEDAGFKNSMISVGGNVRTIGSKLDDRGNEIPWSVGIQNPDLESEQKTIHILNLTDSSLVTSGIYERYYTVDGEIYHHIIDPETLMPAKYFVSVTIACKDSGLGDALSTAVFNMPLDEGLQLIEKLDDVEAMWIQYDGSYKYSSGFKAMIKK